MRVSLALLALPVFAAACTASDPTPPTDTGSLVGVQDRLFADCQDTATFACGVRLSFDGLQMTAVGLHNDGSATGTLATGALNDGATAVLGDLIASIPAEGGTVHDPGCGGAPLRTTGLDIKFDSFGLQHIDVEYATEGSMASLERFVSDLVTDVRSCAGQQVQFDSCTANVQ